MSMTSVKVLAATVLLACGFGLSVGTGWVATAEAQPPSKPAKADADAEVKRLQAELDRARALAEQAAKQAQDAVASERQARDAAERERIRTVEHLDAHIRGVLESLAPGKTDPVDSYTFKTAKYEYELIQVTNITQTKFRELLERHEAKGWEYCGTTPLTDPKVLVWMFRRPVKAAGTTAPSAGSIGSTELIKRYPTADGREYATSPAPSYRLETSRNTLGSTLLADEKAVEAEIAKLTAQLAELKAKRTTQVTAAIRFDKASSPIDPAVLATVLGELGKKKFAADKKFTVAHLNGVTTVTGDKEVIEWATDVVKSLGGKK